MTGTSVTSMVAQLPASWNGESVEMALSRLSSLNSVSLPGTIPRSPTAALPIVVSPPSSVATVSLILVRDAMQVPATALSPMQHVARTAPSPVVVMVYSTLRNPVMTVTVSPVTDVTASATQKPLLPLNQRQSQVFLHWYSSLHSRDSAPSRLNRNL